MRDRFKIAFARVLCESFPSFDFLRKMFQIVPLASMQRKLFPSVVTSLPMLIKDKKKYADLVDILDQMEARVQKIHAKAGLCAPVNEDHIPPGPPIAAPPVQTSQQHISDQFQEQMILSKIRIPCFGDQLTRMWLVDAKDLRAG